ncbi:DICT sensory domain-containing protein [Haloarchaeobius sp. TZWWS8]|uniref:DICT sensory domain-containing protein n=1 Tax=Haloarchaeobius sp. TZWWS8 TaxID=3446121 RepID=UPI003EB74B44
MTLHDILRQLRSRKKTVAVHAPEPIPGLAEAFDTWNVSVVHQPLPDDGTVGYVVVSDESGDLGRVGLAAVGHLVAPSPSAKLPLEHEEESFEGLLGLLDDTVFTSLDKRQLLAAAREIEDRAWRIGVGELHTGFQSLDAMEAQVRVYSQLGSRPELEVHVYGKPGWNPPDLTGVWVYPVDSEEIGQYWFVAYDGGGDDENACALLARQTDSGKFEGFWTYDPVVVDGLVDYVRETYGMGRGR